MSPMNLRMERVGRSTSWVNPPLGEVSEGQADRATPDDANSSGARDQASWSVVSPPSARADQGTTQDAAGEAAWALQLLRDHGEHARAGQDVHGNAEDLAILAQPSRRKTSTDVRTLRTDAETLATAPSAHRAQRAPERSKRVALRSRVREIRTLGSVGAPPGNRRGHPTRTTLSRAPTGCPCTD
jgi:hypothetical protein